MYSVSVQIHVILRMSTQCVREGVHCGVTMETLPDRVPVLPVDNYPIPIPEENATRLSPNSNTLKSYAGVTFSSPPVVTPSSFFFFYLKPCTQFVKEERSRK